MESCSIILIEASTDFRTSFSSPWILDVEKKYELALVSLETYYSYPSVYSANNKFIYSRMEDFPGKNIEFQQDPMRCPTLTITLNHS